MRFEQLRYLEAAVRTGSFRQAAKELGVSQPTITNQVQRLEEDLGVILVKRGSHGVQGTYAAERLLPHVLAAMRAEQLMLQEVSALDELRVGRVRLGTVTVGSMVVLPAVVKRLLYDFPNIRFEVAEGSSDLVRRGVLAGTFDVGLLTRLGNPEDDPDLDRLHFIDLLRGRMVLCVPEGHRLAKVETLDVNDLAGEPLILFREGSALRAAFEKLMGGIEANVVYTTDGAETLQRMVRAGVGISMANTIAPSTVSDDGVTLIPVNQPWARTTLSAVVRKDELRSPVVQTLLRLLKENTHGSGGRTG